MAIIESEEGWLATSDGLKLYTKSWKPEGQMKARLVFLHGFSDHCNWYPELFDALATQGIKVYSFDQRGWGRSVHEPKQRGVTGPTEQVMADITAFIRDLPRREDHIPLFLMGHSMGGGEALIYASAGPREIVSKLRGLLLESPLIGLGPGATPWKLTVLLGRLAAKIAPHMTMLRELDPSTMSRDQEVCKAWKDDPLCHDTGTLEGLAGTLDRTGNLNEGRVVLQEGLFEGGKTRVWAGHGTQDGACDFDSTKQWFERIKVEDKEFRVYDGWYHKLHSEPGQDKVTFANDVAKWILDRSGQLQTTPSDNPRSKL